MGFGADTAVRGSGTLWQPSLIGDAFASRDLCGVSFGRGLFKFHDSESGPKSTEAVVDAVPRLAGNVQAFGFDWLGRQYCAVEESGVSGVVIDPSSMVVEEAIAPDEFIGFFSSPVFVDFLQADLLSAWLDASGLVGLDFNRCAGLKIPQFLGGRVGINNLENSDIEVYWYVMTAAYQQSSSLQPGDQLRGIR